MLITDGAIILLFHDISFAATCSTTSAMSKNGKESRHPSFPYPALTLWFEGAHVNVEESEPPALVIGNDELLLYIAEINQRLQRK